MDRTMPLTFQNSIQAERNKTKHKTSIMHCGPIFLPRPWSKFFTIRASQPANHIYTSDIQCKTLSHIIIHDFALLYCLLSQIIVFKCYYVSTRRSVCQSERVIGVGFVSQSKHFTLASAACIGFAVMIQRIFKRGRKIFQLL